MGSVDIEIKDEVSPYIQDIIDDFIPQTSSMMDDIAEIYKGHLEAEAPIGETQELADLSMWEAIGQFERFIFSGSGHFDWVVLGTEPHDIYPVNAQALFWEGADHPVKHVFHPGTAPNDYPSVAFESADSDVDSRMDEMLKDLIR